MPLDRTRGTMLPLLLPGETLASFLRRPKLYLRLRYRLRLLLWTLQGTQDEPEWYLLKWLVDPDRAAIDVGANYGAYAGRLAALTRRVHCFEPFPAAAECLIARLPPSVIVHQAAASDHAGEARLAVPLRADGTPAVVAASIAADNLQLQNRPVQTVACRLVRLDDVVHEPVGFMKIDVEGHELAVLRGATRILQEHRPILLIESVRHLHAEAPGNIFGFLTDRGYEGIFLFAGQLISIRAFDLAIHQRINADGGLAHPYAWNFIFLPGR
jgi:FkbM family methyltransferase